MWYIHYQILSSWQIKKGINIMQEKLKENETYLRTLETCYEKYSAWRIARSVEQELMEAWTRNDLMKTTHQSIK